MKNILIPTDFSESAENALNYCLNYFKQDTCTFYLLSIHKAWEYTSDDLMSSSSASVYSSLIGENKEQLQELIIRLEKEYENQNYTFHSISDYDVFTDAINQVIELKNIDLIVMGTDGATGAKEAIFGSHTLRVIRQVNCPLLVIPVTTIFAQPEKLLFTLDYNHQFEKGALQPFLEILGTRKISIEVIKMCLEDDSEINGNSVRQQELSEIKSFFQNYETTIHCVKDVSTAEAINSVVQVLKIDINVIPVKREEFIKRLLFGSAISKIIYTTKVPLFIIHELE